MKTELLKVKLEAVPSGVNYDRDAVQTSKSNDGILKYIEQIDAIEQNLRDKILRLQTIRSQIIDEIQTLDNELYIQILYMRYVECKRLEEISTTIAYGYEWTCRLHGRALQEFDRKVLQN